MKKKLIKISCILNIDILYTTYTMDQELIKNEYGAVATTNTPNHEPSTPPPICKMDIDCCEETFDYLQLKDLRAVGQTCKRMNAVAVHIFKENYPGVIARLRDGIIETNDGVQLHGYTRVIRSLSVINGRMCDFNYIATNKFNSLKHIEFCSTDISRTCVNLIKKILGQIESLRFVFCRFIGDSFDGDLYEDMLKFCVNLKHLDVLSFTLFEKRIVFGCGKSWLKKKYSRLEQFKYYDFYNSTYPVYDLQTFFALNSGIRTLVVNQNVLQANRESIMASGLKLECLEIIHTNQNILFDLLNELHAKGFYQRLEIMIFKRNDIKQMKSLQGLEKIQFACEDYEYSNLTELVNLKELKFKYFTGFSIKANIKQLVNLEHIHFTRTYESNIRDFINYSVNLKTIRVDLLYEGDAKNRYGFRHSLKYNCRAILELPEWNTERANLDGARKVKIFVDEQVYLKTKWALKATNFGLIEIKRLVADPSNPLRQDYF